MIFDRRVISQIDWVLLLATFLIPCFGLVVLYSAGYDPESVALSWEWIPLTIRSQAFVKQTLFLSAGIVVLVAAMCIPAQTISRYAYLIYGICIIALILVLIMGQVSNGARRWLNFGGLFLQPSEPMKFGLIVALAHYLSLHPPEPGGYRFTQLLFPAALVLLPMALIIKQPDLGTALAIGGIGAAMVLFTGVRIRVLVTMTALGIGAIIPLWQWMLKAYQKQRVLVLLNPESDPLGTGYHITQSKIAVGSGELLGKGYLQGTQTQLAFLPEHTTDFIFSVLAEEWGFVGCVTVLALYAFLIYRLLHVAARGKDLFSCLMSFGIASFLFFHVVVNIGMVVGVLPVVGIPLSLFSYGGSAVLSTLFSIGLVMGVSMRRLLFLQR